MLPEIAEPESVERLECQGAFAQREIDALKERIGEQAREIKEAARQIEVLNAVYWVAGFIRDNHKPSVSPLTAAATVCRNCIVWNRE